jgi:nucleoid-associated protein YgaU
MHRTDLVTPFAPGPSLASRRSTGFLRLCSTAILSASCAFLFATPCRAQSQSQTTDQDVAEAARQERVRKEALQKKSQHVYTEEDLKRAQILTPEDHAQVVAKKNQQAPPAETEKSEQPSQQAVDAISLPPDAPLGDVARHFRQQKQSQKLQQTADFHLPFADAPKLASPNPTVLTSPEPPVLASPKPPVFVSPKPLVQLLQPRLPYLSKPLAPHFVPYRPLVKRSPFERPKFLVPEPTIASPTRPAVEPKRIAPSRPTIEPKLVAPKRPAAVPMAPTKPPIAPSISANRNTVTVRLGDSLWKLAKQNLGSGLRWRELLSANPTIRDPNRILAGSQIVVPPANSYSATNRGSRASRSRPLPSPRVSSRPQGLADSDLLGRGLHFLPLVTPDH